MSEIINYTVTIDGETIQVPAGTSILNAARAIGGKVVPPAMCVIIANWMIRVANVVHAWSK